MIELWRRAPLFNTGLLIYHQFKLEAWLKSFTSSALPKCTQDKNKCKRHIPANSLNQTKIKLYTASIGTPMRLNIASVGLEHSVPWCISHSQLEHMLTPLGNVILWFIEWSEGAFNSAAIDAKQVSGLCLDGRLPHIKEGSWCTCNWELRKYPPSLYMSLHSPLPPLHVCTSLQRVFVQQRGFFCSLWVHLQLALEITFLSVSHHTLLLWIPLWCHKQRIRKQHNILSAMPVGSAS